VELYLERIARLDSELNAFRVVMSERALADADQADARRGGGEQRPLLGVPVAVKDNVEVAGEVTGNGSLAHGSPATHDAEIVRRLRGAGAVVIGKTNLPELAIIGDTESAAFGTTRNPWDTDRSAAGSSGGSASAVAAGLVGAATASDGAGSIRLPAANCGLFGLKPSRGLISLSPLTDHWFGMSVLGFHTREVADAALLLDVAAEEQPGRPFAESAARPPGRLRIAMSAKPPVPNPLDGEVRAAYEAMGATLRSLGHEVVERDPPYGDAGTNFIPRYLGGVAEEARLVAHPGRLARRTKGFARMGAPFRGALMKRVLADTSRHVARLAPYFEEFDVLLSPMTAVPPVPAGAWEGLGAARTMLGMAAAYPYSAIWNATGQPAASVPSGFTADGLPLGAQLIGRSGDDATLISLAAQVEADRRWADSRPPVG